MMHRRSTRIGLPIAGTARFGRSRTLRHDNIGSMPRWNSDNSDKSVTTMIAHHPAIRDSTPDQVPQNFAARVEVGALDWAAHSQSP